MRGPPRPPTRDAYGAYLRTRRFASLDGLRCLAIVPVFWFHCMTAPLSGVLGRGPLGVDLFFAISGFLITTLLLREGDVAGRVSLRGFYVRRSLRIFPLYYGVLALYVVNAWLVLPDGPQRDHFFRSVVFFATYTTNWFVDFAVPHPVSFAFSWSLAAEEQFYLVWGVVIAAAATAVARSGRWLLPASVALLLLAVDQGVLHGLWTGALPEGSLARRVAGGIASPICMGALLALALHSRTGFAALWALLGSRASALVVMAAVVVAACADGVPLWLAQALMTLLVGACSVRPDHGMAWLFDAAPVRWVGTVSYGMYLSHVALITLARRVLPEALATPAWTFVIVLPVTVAVASASYRWIEQPILRLRARFGARASA